MARQQTWDAIAILFLGLIIFVVVIGIVLSGNEGIAQKAFLFVGPLAPILTGVYGLRQFSKGGLIGRDQFTTMNIFFALGNIILTLAEITSSIVSVGQEQERYFFMVVLLQFPGVLLWGMGCVTYLYGVVKTIKLGNPKKILAFLVIIALLGMIPLTILQLFNMTGRTVIDTVAYLPTLFLLLGIILSLVSLGGVFREGQFLYLFSLLFFGTFLLLVSCVLWGSFGIPPISPVLRLLNFEAYLIITASIKFAATI